MPKRGFTNVNHVEYQVINTGVLNERFADGDVVDVALLVKERLANRTLPVKLLNKGPITKKLTITVNAASQAATKAVQAAGGKVEVL